jgi:hypothetical protein
VLTSANGGLDGFIWKSINETGRFEFDPDHKWRATSQRTSPVVPVIVKL